MLVTLVAILCQGAVCVERFVTDSDKSGITSMSCQLHGQDAIADMLKVELAGGWRLDRYRCVIGAYRPRTPA